MLRRIPVDTHEQRIGIMSTTQTFFAHRHPTTSVSATKAFPQGLRPPAIAKWVAKTAGTVEMGAALPAHERLPSSLSSTGAGRMAF
jgi:hypothetical protein